MRFSILMSAYLRAHQREPIFLMSVGRGLMPGAGARYLTALGICAAWESAISFRCRRERHGTTFAVEKDRRK